MTIAYGRITRVGPAEDRTADIDLGNVAIVPARRPPMGLAAAHVVLRMLAAALVLGASAAIAQPADFYAGKTLRVIVGLEAGGTVDTLARAFSVYLRRHIAGNPHIQLLAPERDRPRFATLLASADALVHGSASETFGMAPAEARACGVPVIVPDQGGAADHALGEVVAPSN